MPSDPVQKSLIQLLSDRRWRSGWLRRWMRELGIAAALAGLVGLIWVVNEGMWTSSAWQTPIHYAGDSLQILGWIQAGMEGDYHVFELNFISRLGAPYEANWNDYPMYEKPFTILLGLLARVIGTGAAANVGMVLVHMLATFSFYLAVRWFRWDRWWCGVAAVVYGLLFYIASRGLGHLLLALIYTLPPALLVTWLVTASRRIGRASPTWCLCVAVSFWMGSSSPYYLNMYLQLVLIGMLMQWLTRRDRANLWAGVHCVLSSAAGFLLIHSGLLMMRFLAGTNRYAVGRKFSEAEIYGLRPIELMMPYPGHRFGPFDSMSTFYKQQSAYYQGEMFSPYLGVMAVAVLIVLICVGVRAIARNRADQVPLPFWQFGWVLVYSVIGGVNAWLAYFGIKLFRASNRYSVFIAVMVLMWAVPLLSRVTRRWPVSAKLMLGVAFVALAWADLLPRETRSEGRAEVHAKIAHDREFADLMAGELPARALVFQLPVANFPEGGDVLRMGAYEQLRPYLAGGNLRFSFGANRGRMDAGWQFDVERLPPREMLRHLEALGFGGLIVNRNGFENRGDRFLSVLQSLGYPLLAVADEHEWVFLPLRPTTSPLEFDPNAYTILDYDSGWTRQDRTADETYWSCTGLADLILNPNIPIGTPLVLEIEAGGPIPARLRVSLGDDLLIDEVLSPEGMKSMRVEFTRPAADEPIRLRASQVGAGGSNVGGQSFVVRQLSVKLRSGS